MGGYIGASAGGVANAAERKQTYSITTATTSLTGLAYTPTKVHVFHNGVRLVDGTDYTATNGTSITLTNAAQNGDEVVVISYPSFQTSDTVSAANGGTFAGNVTMSSDLNVDTIKNTSGTTAMTINSSGVVTAPAGIIPKSCAFQMHPTSTQTLTNGAEGQIEFQASNIDTNSIVDLSNNRVVITAATAGLYWLSFTFRLSNSAPARIVNYIKVNGTQTLVGEENSNTSGTTGSQSNTVAGLVSLSSGDILTYHIFHNHGADRVNETGVTNSRAEGYRIGSV